jgi:hypothetical protein
MTPNPMTSNTTKTKLRHGRVVRLRIGRVVIGGWWDHVHSYFKSGRFMYGWSRTHWVRVGRLTLHVEIYNSGPTP